MTKEIYLIGGFSGWRKGFEEAVPNVKFDNPINHKQYSIAELNHSDIKSAKIKPSLAYIEKGKRLGTMSYSELGAARVSGMPIISVDENEIKDSILERIATYKFNSKVKSYEFLREGQELFSRYYKIKADDKTKSFEDYKSILFTGDYEKFKSIKMPKGKEIYFTEDYMDNLDNLAKDVDLIVTNFDAGKKHNSEGLFFMGAGAGLKIPVILLEGNNIPYPPLVGLSRRPLFGEKRFEYLEEYLKNLGSQHISDEALTYYNLMNKFNK